MKMAHVAAHKKEKVKIFTKLIEEYPIVGVVNMNNLPTKQLQKMRSNLRNTVLLKMTKKRLLKIAIGNSKKPAIDKLIENLKGMPALLFTKENPFLLYSILKKNKSSAPISAGQVAPNDIVVPAGKTNFSPGPIIGELGSFGIKAGVENGKIAIKEDRVVAEEGTVVNAKLAGLLQRLGVEPMEIGLDLVAMYENGEILTKSVLDIDEDAYKKDFKLAASMAFNLAFNTAYPTDETIKLLIQKVASESKALATEANILTDETVGLLLSKVELEAKALKSKVNLPDTPVEVKEEAPTEPAAEKPVEEAKEEVKPEEVKEAPKEEPATEEDKAEEVKEAPKEEPATEEAKPEEVKKAPKEEPAEKPVEEAKEEETTTEEKKEEQNPEEKLQESDSK